MENQPSQLRAVGYRRVSSKEKTDGHSLDAQEVHLRNFAQSQNWNLNRIYYDAGISAKKDSRRPALEQLMADAEAGKFDVVIVDTVMGFVQIARISTERITAHISVDRIEEMGKFRSHTRSSRKQSSWCLIYMRQENIPMAS